MSKISIEQFDQLMQDTAEWYSSTSICLESVETDGITRMRYPYDASTTRAGGTISGPAMMTLADACMYAVVLAHIGQVELAVTTNLNINFLRKPHATDLIAEGRMIKLGKRLAVIEVSILSDHSSDIVAHATGTYSIPPPEYRPS